MVGRGRIVYDVCLGGGGSLALFCFLCVLDGSETPAKRQMEAIRAERGYAHADEVACSAAAMGDAFPAKCAAFFEEHLHEDEEIRYVGGGATATAASAVAGSPCAGRCRASRLARTHLSALFAALFVVLCFVSHTTLFEPVPGMVSLFVECSHCVLSMLLALSCCFLLPCRLSLS